MTAPTTPVPVGPPALPPPTRGRSVGAEVKRHLEALPLRVRLVAVMLVLLLMALTLTASATAALMRRDLVGRVDQQLRLAAEPVAKQAFNDLGSAISEGIPNGYAFIILPNDGRAPIAANPIGEPM